MDVSRAETEFPLSLLDKKLIGELLHQTFHYVSRAIRTVVLNDQDVKLHREVEDISDYLFDILFLVIRWDDD